MSQSEGSTAGGGNRVFPIGDGHRDGQPHQEAGSRITSVGAGRDPGSAPPLGDQADTTRSPRRTRERQQGSLKENPLAPRRHGFPRLIYWLAKLFRVHDRDQPEYYWVPVRPSRWEQAARAIEMIRTYADEARRGVFGCLNVKGGASKTITIVHLASIMAEVTRATVILIDCNPASGTSGKKVGRSYDKTITVQKLLEKIRENPNITAAELLDLMRPTKYGVRVVAAAPIINPQNRMYEKAWDEIFEVLTTRFEYIFVDMGNDITDNGLQTIWKNWIDVPIVTATVGIMPDSLPQMVTTELTLANFGYDDFAVANAIGVFSNGYARFIAKYLLEAVEFAEDGETVVQHRGPSYAVPPDKFLNSTKFNNGGVNFRSLRSRTLQSYRELLIAALWLRIQLIERQRAARPRQPQGG